ncbi:MAG: sulfotransferase family protein, partial [Acidimicrobiales bacterium]
MSGAGPRHPYDLVLVIGAPRSGTTWLQRLLGSHDAVATTQETDLLDKYVGRWLAQWDQHLPADPAEWAANRHKGLPAVLTEAELVEILGSVTTRVYDKVASLKPTASVVLDKNPDYGPVLARVAGPGGMLPECRVVHLIRDGRDVAASLVAAGTSWGSSWAPRQVGAAARWWRERVLAARGAGLGPDRYLEVRYEDLEADGAACLARCLAFCGVEAGEPECAAALARFPLGGGDGAVGA